MEKAFNIKCKKFEKCNILNLKIELEELKIRANLLKESEDKESINKILKYLKIMDTESEDLNLRLEIAAGIVEIYFFLMEEYQECYKFISEIEDEDFMTLYTAYYTKMILFKYLCKTNPNKELYSEIEILLKFYKVFGGNEEYENLRKTYLNLLKQKQ